jgi:hypothetical protein
LTPEAAGVASAANLGPGRAPIPAWIRRFADRGTLMIGGRNFSRTGERARIRIAIDERLAHEFEADPGFFLQMLPLGAGALTGPDDYARMAVSASQEGVAIEQFDVQPAGSLLFGYGEGWHEHEYNPATGEQWRWTSDRAAIRVRSEGQPLTLTLRGEAEGARRSRVVVRLAGRTVADETVGRRFSLRLQVPADPAAADGESLLTIETDGSYVPAEARWRSNDRRRLGLKVLECALKPVS